MANTRSRAKHVKDFYRKKKAKIFKRGPYTDPSFKQKELKEALIIETKEAYSKKEKFESDYGRKIF